MAYRKRQTTRKYSRRSYGRPKRNTYTRTSAKRRISRRAPTQTLRIVVEQPSANSSVQPTAKPARKAVF